LGITAREKRKEQVVEKQIKMERGGMNEKHFISLGGGDLTFYRGDDSLKPG
jgi:hypothetical protein